MENGAIGRTGGIVLWRVARESKEESDIVRTPHRHTGEQTVLVLPTKVRRVYNLTVLVHPTFFVNYAKWFIINIVYYMYMFKFM